MCPCRVAHGSKSRGLFAGVDLNGTVLIERKDGNAKFYGREGIRAAEILRGDVDPPEEVRGAWLGKAG